MWEGLRVSDMEKLDRIKPAFLKRVLDLHTSTRNRLVYLLLGTTSFVEYLQQRFAFDKTKSYEEFIISRAVRFMLRIFSCISAYSVGLFIFMHIRLFFGSFPVT